MKKKGQIFDQFGGLATGIAALAILLVVAFLIMSTGKEQVVDLIDATAYSNATFSGVSFDSAFTLFTNCIDDESLTLTAVYNGSVSLDTSLPSANILANSSVSLNTVNFSNKSGEFETTSFNVTYSCKEADEAYNSTANLQVATDQVPTWVPIIVITFIGVILLGLVGLLRRTSENV